MKIYVKFEEGTGKIISTDSIKLSTNTEIEVDDGFDEMTIFNYKYEYGKLVELTPEEKEEFYPKAEKTEEEKQNDQLTEMIKASSTKTYLENLADEQACLIPFCYDAWDDFNEGFSIEKDSRVQSTGKLFKAKNTVLKTQLRPENDPDNFDDLTGSPSTGSEEDVITLPDNVMTQGYSYVYGKFYKKNGNEKVYQCYRGGLSEEVANSMFGQVQVLYFYPDALLGSYFREKV